MILPILLVAFWSLNCTASSFMPTPTAPHARQLIRRNSIDFKTVARSPFDHSWIKEWAAVGDSFASAVGAGTRVNWGCSRYDGAYGNLINDDPSLGNDPGRKFHFLPCLGHEIGDVLEKQVNTLSDNTIMMMTLSAGGNDVFFKDVVDACTYMYLHEVHKCDHWLLEARNEIEKPSLAQKLDDLAQGAIKKLAFSNSKIFWTAYAKYFDTSTTKCDKVTWSGWFNLGDREFLTQKRRTEMNDLVDLMNTKIKAAAARAGDQVIFVEWEHLIDDIDGKYCEPGVDETSGKGDDRETLAFYEWYSTLDDKVFGNNLVDETRISAIPDYSGNSFTAADAPVDQMGPYEANIVSSFKTSMDNDPGLIEGWKQHNPDLHNVNDTLNIASWLSDKYLRLFHPQFNAHQNIAFAVLSALEDIQAKELGQPSATTTTIGCSATVKAFSDQFPQISNFFPHSFLSTPAGIFPTGVVPSGSGIFPTGVVPSSTISSTASSTTSSTPSPTASSTTLSTTSAAATSTTPPPAPLPPSTLPVTRNVDLGIVTCASENNSNQQGDPNFFMTLDNANDAIFDFCQSLGGNAIVFGPGPSDSKTQTQQDNFIAVTAKFEGGANCPPPLNFMDVTQVDANVQTCQDRLEEPVNNCDTASNGLKLWKQGGSFFRDCMTWSISKVPS